MSFRLTLLLSLLLTACAQPAYLAQSLGGHLQLLVAAKPVDELLADPATDKTMRERLHLSQDLRDFSVERLHLPDNSSYRRYADLGRKAAVWNVVATPELSLELKTWCFPLMGCVGYRGYFDRTEAEAYAASLRAEGLEALVYGVPAYSTLGWSNWLGGDPLLNTFIAYPQAELARMMFHELAHQIAYAADDTQFNESFATAVERLGAATWLQTRGNAAAREQYLRANQRREQFASMTRAYRLQLQALYASDRSDAAKRAGKAELMQAMRAEYLQLKAGSWAGHQGYEGWFADANNASLALLSAYSDLSPAFEAMFLRKGSDWTAFYAEVRRLAALPRQDRRLQLSGDQ